MSSFDLNDVKAIYSNDSTGMLESLAGLPRQCMVSCLQLPQNVDVKNGDKIKNIVVAGIGGSAIGGDLLRVYTAGKIKIPVVVSRDYSLPAFVGPETLLFAVSYSGNTEETLSAVEQGRKMGANIVVITSGGKLMEMALSQDYPLVRVPQGFSPRAATGFLFIPTLRVLEKAGFLENITPKIEVVQETLKCLHEKLRPESPVQENPAKQLALKLYCKIPVIWGVAGTSEVVAQRWKGQINENAKAPAYWNVFPELNHNEIVGFKSGPDLLKNIQVVILRDEEDHPRVQQRIEITKRIINPAVSGITEVSTAGKEELARLFSLIYSGDYTSVYLSMLYGVDPGPVEVIESLKKELARVQ